ncbi:hypothetical protein GOP47_0019510 [Adiantum capillus-veneris]|uniref:Uncharacterized protein n=1 Tax=Adiantum capillus-veneris TaxID=13818 RepID=A0A9D4UBN6_ADICA|nr:hypothetical protein GOP47_0019510 [Adiantum capillus-veneris]
MGHSNKGCPFLGLLPPLSSHSPRPNTVPCFEPLLWKQASPLSHSPPLPIPAIWVVSHVTVLWGPPSRSLSHSQIVAHAGSLQWIQE